jgi:hypothetical protein
MNVPVATYRNWIYGRRAIPEPVALLTRYLERYGPLDTVAS